MDESEGVFAKRRRNLLIAGVVVIIIAVANPSIDELTLFGIKFDFTGRVWLIWLGLTIWLVYASIRVFSFFITYIKTELKKSKNLFIYGDDKIIFHWANQLENFRKTLDEKLTGTKLDDGSPIKSIYYRESPNDFLTKLVASQGKLNTVSIIFGANKEIKVSSQDFDIIRDVDFTLDEEMKTYILLKKVKYRLVDDWWEYKFILIFAVVSFAALFIGWTRLYWK